jgi:hypothetical protein
MLLGSPRYYPKAQIRQGADRVSAPPAPFSRVALMTK